MTAAPNRITKRLIVSVLASLLIYYSLKIHRDWVWAYFESLLNMPTPTPEMANVATASINAITTAFTIGSASISFIVAFFITGNTAALLSSFKWSTMAQSAGQMVNESVNNLTTTTERTPKASHFDDLES